MSLIHQALSKSKKPAWPAVAAKATGGGIGPWVAVWIPFVLGLAGVLSLGAVAFALLAPPVSQRRPTSSEPPRVLVAPPRAELGTLTPGDPNDVPEEAYRDPFEGLSPGDPRGAGVDGVALRPATVIRSTDAARDRSTFEERIPVRDAGASAPASFARPFSPRILPSEVPAESVGDPEPARAPATATARREASAAPEGAPRIRPIEMSAESPITVTPAAASLASMNGRIEVTGGEAAPGARLAIGSKVRANGGTAQVGFAHADVTVSGDGVLEIRRNETREGPDGIARNATVKVDGGRADVTLRPTTPRDAFLLSAGKYTLSAPSGAFSVESAADGASRVTVRDGIVIAHPHDGSAPIRIESGQVRELR